MAGLIPLRTEKVSICPKRHSLIPMHDIVISDIQSRNNLLSVINSHTYNIENVIRSENWVTKLKVPLCSQQVINYKRFYVIAVSFSLCHVLLSETLIGTKDSVVEVHQKLG